MTSSSDGSWLSGSGNQTMTTTTTMTTMITFVDLTSNCTLPSPSTSKYNVVTATILASYLAFGFVCTFLGYRVFKAIMFFTGFIFGSLIVYLICLEDDNDILPMWSNVCISICAGILFGLITLLVQYVGLFMLGFHTGLLLGLVALCAVQVLWYIPGTPWITVGFLLASGVTMSMFNLYFQKSFTILGSALYGGAIITVILDYFLENSIMLMWIWDKVKVAQSDLPCWFSWITLSIWPITFIIGVMTQCLVAGSETYHEQQFPPRHKSPRTKPETREERKQRKYRYLYQVRTCHGDVISQPIAKKYVHQVNDESFA